MKLFTLNPTHRLDPDAIAVAAYTRGRADERRAQALPDPDEEPAPVDEWPDAATWTAA